MNILLVDDQPNIISSLVSSISWHSLGFSSIYTATSALAARDILNKHKVDILLTDIEMPNEDGLSLINWIRESGLDPECILLTSHADFFYAKRAISLKVSDYIIQPAKDEDIIRAVKNAIASLETREKKESFIRYSGLDFAAKNIEAKSLFDNWPSYDESLIDPQAINDRAAHLREFDIQCGPNDSCVLLYMHIRKWHKLPLGSSAVLLKFQEILGQTSQTLNRINISYYTSDNSFYTVFFSPLTEELTLSLQSVYKKFDTSIGCKLRMFYCETDFRHIKEGLNTLYYEASSFGIAHASEDVCFQQIQLKPSVWEVDASYERYDKYINTIKKYIRKNISEPITRTQIAEALFLSPSHVSHIIKVTEDMTCKELITKIKMEYAQKLLRSSKCSIGDVAVKCGYDSFAYFSKVYKQTFSITPSMERQEANK